MGHLGCRIRWLNSFSHLPKVRSSSGKKMSHFENQNLPLKTYLSCPVLFQDSKNVICFVVRQLEIPTIDFQKSDVITLTWPLGHCTAKNKDIGLKFCTAIVGT